jgi:hypothetical protein
VISARAQAPAGHSKMRILTAIPRAVGRNYGNMFTFKHPWVAVQQWSQVATTAFMVHENYM